MLSLHTLTSPNSTSHLAAPGRSLAAGIILALSFSTVPLACSDDSGRHTSDGTSTRGSDATDTSSAPTTGAGTGGATASHCDIDPTSCAGTSGTTDSSATGEEPRYCGYDPPPGLIGPFNVCKTAPKVGGFTPVVEWVRDIWKTHPDANQIIMTPIVAPLTDDDHDGVYGSEGDLPAVVVMTFAADKTTGPGVLRALRGDGSTELFAVADPGLWGGSGIAVGDIDGDQRPDIIALAAEGVVKAFSHEGALKWSSAPSLSDVGSYLPHYASPAIADMDADGRAEIIVGRLILNHDGTVRGKGAYGLGGSVVASASFAVDLDADGVQEVVVGNALYRPDGSAIWSNDLPDGYPAVADFTADTQPEIVVVTDGSVRLQAIDGSVLWSVANPAQTGGPPTIADFDGDGKPEIGIAGRTGYVVLDTDGAVLWQRATKDASSGITGSSVYDFEGDGVADVVYADEIDLYVYSGLDGAIKLKYSEHNSGTALEYPVVADVDNDGEVELLVVQNTVLGQGQSTGITVLGDKQHSWRPGRRIWNQHAYSITNVNDDGTLPLQPAPNWLTFNNFRSGDISPPDGLVAPDLQISAPESCIGECVGSNQAVLWFQVKNAGSVPQLAGATVEVRGSAKGVESLLTTVDVPGPLAPGEVLPAMNVLVDVEDVEQIRLVLVSNEIECIVDLNNEILLQPPYCGP